MKKVTVTVTFIMVCISYHAKSQQKIVVYFPFNKSYITNEAASVLDSAVKRNSNKIIDSVKIYAWCDAIGTLLYNDTLALQRAASVKNFLLRRKIGLNGFKEITGYGKRAPVNNNSNESLRALNRRAEVLIFARKALFRDSMRFKIRYGKTGDNFRVNNLNFYGGRHIPLPASRPLLDTLANILKAYPSVEIEIQGYVCCVPPGTEGFDRDAGKWNLSVNRALMVYEYLVANGIAPNRLSYKGFGNHPLVSEITDMDRTINRRVEIKILKR